MEPLSALGIAAAAIQFVDFTTKLLSAAVETHKKVPGETQRVTDLKEAIRNLAVLTDRIEEKGRALHHDAPPDFVDAVFLDACSDCKKISQELAGVLQTLSAKHAGKPRLRSARSSLAAAIKGAFSQGRINDLTARLDTIQDRMQMAALVSLWEKAQKDGQTLSEVSQQQRDAMAALAQRDDTAQYAAEFVGDLNSGLTSHRGSLMRHGLIHAVWSTEWMPNLDYMGELEDSPSQTLQRQLYLVGRLLFDEIKDREEAIPQAYTDTFGWVFEVHPDARQGSSWPSFPLWLESDTQEVYWITGKPGAGKSTLMKFLTADVRLRYHLTVGSGNYKLLMASFYFWNAGTGLQKSHVGLLRTLLSQCLCRQPDLVPHVLPRRWAILRLLGSVLRRSDLPPWEWDELVEALKSLASHAAANGYRLALFIDGLDEFDGEPAKLVELISDLSHWKGVKICVSSRPWNIFSDAYGRSPSLKVQDLTKNDITRFVRGHFEPLPAFNELQAADPAEAARLLDDVAERADGVFLWVSVVVRALSGQLIAGDRLADLRATLDQLPRDVEDLFEAIRRRIDPQHVAHSSKYLLLLLAALRGPGDIPPSAMTFFLADEDWESPLLRELGDASEGKRAWMVSTMRRRLHSRTMGLIEVLAGGGVSFLHRTVFDWVMQSAELARIKRDAPDGFSPHLELFKARAAELEAIRPKLVAPGHAMPAPLDNEPGTAATHEESTLHHGTLHPLPWKLLAVCLRHAALAGVGVTDSNRDKLLRTMAHLQTHLDRTIAVHHLENWTVKRSDRGYQCTDERHKTKPGDLLQVAARYAILPFVANELLDETALRRLEHSGACYHELLRDVVLGHLTPTGDQDAVLIEGYISTAPAYTGVLTADVAGETVPPLRATRLLLLRHILRVAPHNRRKRAVMREIRALLTTSDRRYHVDESRYAPHLKEMAAFLDYELRPWVWAWRYLVKESRHGGRRIDAVARLDDDILTAAP